MVSLPSSSLAIRSGPRGVITSGIGCAILLGQCICMPCTAVSKRSPPRRCFRGCRCIGVKDVCRKHTAASAARMCSQHTVIHQLTHCADTRCSTSASIKASKGDNCSALYYIEVPLLESLSLHPALPLWIYYTSRTNIITSKSNYTKPP